MLKPRPITTTTTTMLLPAANNALPPFADVVVYVLISSEIESMTFIGNEEGKVRISHIVFCRFKLISVNRKKKEKKDLDRSKSRFFVWFVPC